MTVKLIVLNLLIKSAYFACMHVACNIYIYYEIVLKVQTANKHVQNLTSTNTVNQGNHIRGGKKAKVSKREITIMDEQ